MNNYLIAFGIVLLEVVRASAATEQGAPGTCNAIDPIAAIIEAIAHTTS